MEVDEREQGALLTVAVSLGLLGNIPVIVWICQRRRLLKDNYYYIILHLAICDLFYLLLFIPDIYSIFNASPSAASSSYLPCKILWPAHTAVFTAGTNFLVIISILRYRAVIQPLTPAVSRTKLKIILTTVYVIAIICIIPYVMVLRFDEMSGCNEEWPTQSLYIAYTMFLLVIQFFLPVASLSIIYFKIGKEVLTRNNRIGQMYARNQTQQQSTATPHQHLKIKEAKPLLVSFSIVACFIVSGFPAQMLWILFVSKRDNRFLLAT